MRRALAVIALVGLLACDDTNERRAAAIQATRGADAAEADRGATELEKILEKSPRDRLALSALAEHYQRRGRTDDARYLYERLVASSGGTEEAERAKEQLAKIGLPAASAEQASASAPGASGQAGPALAPTAIALGKGIATVTLGMSREAAEKLTGPCEREAAAAGATTCTIFGRGMEIVYKDGKVTRIGLYGPDREIVSGRGERTKYRPFAGQSAEGIALGMPASEAQALLGPPTARRVPASALITRDGSITMDLWDYPKKGVTLEIDQTPKGLIVSGIQIPTIEGRPLPAPGGKP